MSPAALREAARVLEAWRGEAEVWPHGARSSVAQSPEGNLFVTTSHQRVGKPIIGWALINVDGERKYTIWCEESAVGEACRIGPWDVHALMEDLARETPTLMQVVEWPRPVSGA